MMKFGDLFSLCLPPKWLWQDGGDAVTLFHPDGVGALTISVVTLAQGRDASDVARELASSFATQRAWDVPAAEIHVAGTNERAVSELEYWERGDQSAYWQVWHLVDGARAALITYTSNSNDAQTEAAERRDIVDSFRWLQPPSPESAV
jgi:hypothetical protein